MLPVVTYAGPMNGTNALVVTYADVQRDRLSNYPKWTASLATSPDTFLLLFLVSLIPPLLKFLE